MIKGNISPCHPRNSPKLYYGVILTKINPIMGSGKDVSPFMCSITNKDIKKKAFYNFWDGV